MPLLNGQPVERIPPPANVDNSRTSGWEIRFTGERFDDYEKYMDRLALYRKPVWTCAQSGRTCLTYEQALLEERAEAHLATGIGFSDMLVCAMLTFLTQSTLPISQAVDALYYRFQYDFFIGEHIDVRYPDTEGAMYECTVVGVGPLPQQPAPGADGETPPLSASASAAIERLGDGAEHVIAYEGRKSRMYTVCLFDMNGSPIEGSEISVHATELSRSRNVFTKVALRQFLDEHMRRDPRPSSPWIVRAEWRERFHIPYMLSGDAQLLRRPKPVRRESDMFAGVQPAAGAPANGAARRKNSVHVVVDPYAAERSTDVKVPRKFPTDDLEHLQFQHVRMEESILWALRRRHEKLTNTAQDLEKAARGHKITDFFAVAPAKRVAEPAECGAIEQKLQSGDEKALENRWPVPLCKWQIPAALVSRALSVYMFVSCFSTPLKLQPYPLDYFESALVYSPPASAPEADADASMDAAEAPAVSSVFRESALALLNSIIADRVQGPTPANVAARIERMVALQGASMSEPEDAPAKVEIIDVDDSQSAAKQDSDVMEVVEVDSGETTPRKRGNSELPPAGPMSEERVSKRRASGRLSDKGQASGRLSEKGRTRLQRASLLSASSSIASSDSESGNESAESSATAGSARKSRAKSRGAKRAASTRGRRRGRGGRSSKASSRVATPATTDNEEDAEEPEPKAEPRAADVEELRGHALLRHLSRSWAQLAAGARGEWAQKLVGWIAEARHDYSELTPIHDALWSIAGLSAAGLEAALWGATTAEQRLVMLELLVVECTNNESIRQYLDQCADTSAELKRERLELRRELKRATEALAELDKEDAQNIAAAVVSREQGRREKEEEVRRQKERRRLGESERQSLRRLDYIERELRRNNIGRLAPLGCDRFFNRYYFIDGIGGCPMTGGTGRIFVQPAAAAEQAEVLQTQPRFVASLWALNMPAAWTGGLAVAGSDAALADLAFPGRENSDGSDPELQRLGASGELWGYYATTAQVDALKRWLDPKGRREAALLAELDLLNTAVSGSIRRRCQSLEQSFEARARAREHLCDRINTHLDAVSAADDQEDPELARLHRELSRLDATVVPASLLPPSMVVDEQMSAAADALQTSSPLANGFDEAAAGGNASSGNGSNGNANNGSVSNGNATNGAAANGSSRASSVEPSSSVDLSSNPTSSYASSKRQSITRAPRGRRPKNRVRRFKTYMDEFLEYENAL